MKGRRVLSSIGVILALALVWEGYKVLGVVFGGTWPGTEIAMKPRPDDRNMPHVWEMVFALFQPARRGGDLLLLVLLKASLYTLREAFLGFLAGAAFGFGLGVLFVRSRLLERAFLPYVVASQTIPIVAIAPLVVVWGGRLSIPPWISVAIIASYLTFFPVAINTLRGLRSPEATATEMFRSLAATPTQALWKLQVPAALPYIFTGLRVAATASVIGALVGELPTGVADGLGRALLQFNQVFSSDPSKLYAAVLISALAGIVLVGVVVMVERYAVGRRPQPEMI